MDEGLRFLAAAIAVGLGGLGPRGHRSRRAAGAGAIAEKPELTGTMIILAGAPENDRDPRLRDRGLVLFI